MINFKLILLQASHTLDRRAVHCFTESLAICTQVYVFLKLILPLFKLGDKILKGSLLIGF